MHFHFENLGLLDQVDLELADLTLICGENNTGKTYATYAIYGFLRSWREILTHLLRREIATGTLRQNNYRVDLSKMFAGKLDSYLARMGQEYIRALPSALATESNMYKRRCKIRPR